MKQTIELLKRRMVALFWKVANEKEALTIDGMPGYDEKAQFVGGKVINQCAYVVTDCLPEDEQARGRQALREIIRMVSVLPWETWGILNGLEGLYRLHSHGLLTEIVEPDVLAQLRQAMDWRTFVDVAADYALIHKPTNYYGVAFGIARYRELLGWEPLGNSAILLDRLLTHITRYSGSYGFMDETQGDGRFDRYSILVPSEITALVLDTHWEEPELIRSMLNTSAHIFLQLADEAGTGVSYGRSIGAYGETAALQTLAAAAMLGGIFADEQETALAFGYSCRLIRRMVGFWYDEEMQSINMWEKGRRTDEYRNKHRILGENLSLNMQVVNVIEQWEKAGFTWDSEPEGWTDLLAALPQARLIRFARDAWDRCLAIVRDGKHVWSLPIISGGREYYDKDPYLTVPRENLTLEAVPDTAHGALLPLVHTASGDVMMPACFAQEVTLTETAQTHEVHIRYPQLCQKPAVAAEIATAAGRKEKAALAPVVPCNGYEMETLFRFAPGAITRTDTLTWQEDIEAPACITLSFETFSSSAEPAQNTLSFAEGPIRSFTADRYALHEIGSAANLLDAYGTPHGAQQTVCRFTHPVTEAEKLEHCLTLSWTFTY